jgi:hypothetical protein
VWGGAFGYSARGAVAAQTLAAVGYTPPHLTSLLNFARRRIGLRPLISHLTFRGKKAVGLQRSPVGFDDLLRGNIVNFLDSSGATSFVSTAEHLRD